MPDSSADSKIIDAQLALEALINGITAKTLSFTSDEIHHMLKVNTKLKIPLFFCSHCEKCCAADVGVVNEKNYMPYFAYIVNPRCKQHEEEFMIYKNAEKL